MKLYIDLRLASDDDAVVQRVKIKGVTEQEAFGTLARVVETSVGQYARDVVIEHEHPEGTVIA